MYIYSYNQASEGSKALAEALGAKRIKHQGSKFKGSLDKVVLNWGSSSLPDEVMKCRILNNTGAIGVCTNKATFFSYVNLKDDEKKINLPSWTRNQEDIIPWLKDGIVVARTVLNGHSGQGIVLIDNEANIVPAPLYTKYIPKKDEFRIHVINGEVVDIQQKKKKNDFEGVVNYKIRNLQNGFIYARTDVLAPDECSIQAKAVITLLGLDIGAVDILWNDHQKKAYVLEVNTAPGLKGTTLEIYSKKIKEMLNV